MDDPLAKRADRFARKRRNRTVQQAARTPLDRLASSDDLRSLWQPSNVPGTIRPTDEPIELWRAVRARQRDLA